MEAMNAAKAATVDTATLAALLDGDGDGAAAAGVAGDGVAVVSVAVVAGVTPVIVAPV